MAFIGYLGNVGSQAGLIELGFVPPGTALPTNVYGAIPQGGVVPYLWYRVLDPFGNEVISNLAHLKSKWTIKAPMPGQVTGSSVIGDFQIDLPTPGTPEWKDNAQDFAQLNINYRVEGYYGQPGAGNPRVAGIIREKPTSFNNFSLKGIDSIGILLGTATGRSESFAGRTDQLFMYALQGYALQPGASDDFSGTLALWTNNGAFTLANNPNGLASIKSPATANGDGLLYSTTSYANATYANCSISGWFYLICANTSGSAAEAGCVAALQDANNYILGRANMRQAFTQGSNNSRYEIDAEIWIKSLGSWTLLNRKTNVVVSPNNNTWLQVTLSGKQIGNNYQWEVQLNGAPSGCLTQYQAAPAGMVGFRSYIASQVMGAFTFNATNSVTYLSNVSFVAKQSLVNPGNIVQGTKSITQTFSNTHSLDLINLAAMTEGYSWRKNCGVGIDTIDYGPTVGTDYTSRVIFIEGQNLEKNSSVDTNFDAPVTANRLFGSPGQDNAGYIEWVNIAAAKKYGYWLGTLSVDEASDFGAQQRLVQTITNLQAAPGSAKDLFVVRDEETADVWRELDYVAVYSERLGFNMQSVQVMGYTLEEGNTAQEIIGDQYPKSMIVADLRRLRSLLDGLATGTGSVSPSVSSAAGGVVYDSRYGSPSILSFNGGFQTTSVGNPGVGQPYRLVFQIPTNFAVIQKVLLTVVPSTSSSSAGSTGNTTATNNATTPTADASGESGHSHGHSHVITINAGTGANGNITIGNANPGDLWNASGVANNAATNTTTTASSGHSHNHTHGSHNHTQNAHSHSITAGTPGSGPSASGITVWAGTVDGTMNQLAGFGPYTATTSNIDITTAISTNSSIGFGSGVFEIDLATSTAGGLIAYLLVIGIVKSL